MSEGLYIKKDFNQSGFIVIGSKFLLVANFSVIADNHKMDLIRNVHEITSGFRNLGLSYLYYLRFKFFSTERKHNYYVKNLNIEY